MTKCNKTLLIFCLVLVFSISITFAFVSLSKNVYADTINDYLNIESTNYNIPIAVKSSNTSSYPLFVNAMLSISWSINYENNSITFNTYTTSSYKDIITRYTNYTDPIFNQEYTTISTNSQSFSLDKFKISNSLDSLNILPYLFNETSLGYNVYFYINACKSQNNLKNVDYLEIDTYSHIFTNTSDAISGTRFTYYDSFGNWLSFMPLSFYYSPVDVFPNKDNNFTTNWNILNNDIYKRYPLFYNSRRYYASALTANQINNESYNQGYNYGYKNGYDKGEIDGYELGYDEGNNYGYKNGYDKGKIDGISSKGENVWASSNEFVKNIFVGIFDILSIEFLPNVSLGTFVIIPLIFSVLFFIVKVAKGGGD